MTEQQQRAACAELARRMGWREGEFASIWFPPDGNLKRVQADPPDYFTDPAASRELVAWLAKQSDGIWGNFSTSVIDSAIPFDQQAYADWEMIARAVMTADLPVIARAACKALGIEVSE